MNKLEWYQAVEKYINENLHEFYKKLYDTDLTPAGASYRMNPCPSCGHNNCCTISGNTLNCFSPSCEWSGTHISAWYAYMDRKKDKSIREAINALESFTGIKFPHCSPEEMAAYEAHHKKQAILSIAEDYYHQQLMECTQVFTYNNKEYIPLDYMLNVRCRKRETLKAFKIGFVNNYIGLYNKLLEEGYTRDEIKESKAWFPDKLFVFFYRNPVTKDIVRVNTKNPFNARYTKVDEVGNRTDGEIIVGHSSGPKTMYFSPSFDFNKDFVLVEGEHDVMAVFESGEENVCGTGGKIRVEDNQLAILNKAGEDVSIYTMYDNDNAGDEYTNLTNDYFADRPVKQILYDNTFKDPDEFFKCSVDAPKIHHLMDNAKSLLTAKNVIRKQGAAWVIATRDRKLVFTLKGKTDKGALKGSVVYYQNGIINDRDEDVSLIKCKAKMKPLNFELYDHLENYFNSSIETKSINELISVYSFSSKKMDIMKELAKRVYSADDKDSMVNDIKVKIHQHISRTDDLMDEILKEVNDIQNRESNICVSNIPKIRIGQYFNVRNNDAYMYFTYIKNDGDAMRKLPFLLRNDGTLIRLDLLKRKDSQCLLLIDNKYVLPVEIPAAIMDVNECSLTPEWVEAYIEKSIPADELDPGKLVSIIESYLKRFYYTDDPSVYKVVALYIYSTYYYELFAQIPYLFLNGSKGSGKSILNECIRLFAFNVKMAIDISEASIFRLLDKEGGTLILDEQENLTGQGRTLNNSLAAILKGGYCRSGNVIRSDVETGGTVKYDAYGPKVISCINGIDDVIEDRCIIVTSYPLKLTKDTKMEDPKLYTGERLDEIKEVTSKCALSALTYFKELSAIYNDSLFETDGNARLSQIMTPILAVAKLADKKEREEAMMLNPELTDYIGKFEKGIVSYWNFTLKSLKSSTEKDTPEGIIKRAVMSIARELYGLVPASEIEYTDTTIHKYNEPIKFNKDEGWFEVNIFHFKSFIEEIRTGEAIQPRAVSRWVKTVFKFPDKDIKRRTIIIENEELLKELKGSANPKVAFFKFYFKDFINLDKEFLEDKVPSNKQDEPLF